MEDFLQLCGRLSVGSYQQDADFLCLVATALTQLHSRYLSCSVTEIRDGSIISARDLIKRVTEAFLTLPQTAYGGNETCALHAAALYVAACSNIYEQTLADVEQACRSGSIVMSSSIHDHVEVIAAFTRYIGCHVFQQKTFAGVTEVSAPINAFIEAAKYVNSLYAVAWKADASRQKFGTGTPLQRCGRE